MRIVYFAKTSEIGPSSRYRIYQYVSYLRSGGVDIEVRPLFGAVYFWLLTWRVKWWQALGKAIYVVVRFTKRAIDLATIGQADLVVIEGQLYPYLSSVVERWLARRYKFVLEFDDAIYLTRRHERKIPVLLQLSSGAFVGNHTLAHYARAFAPRVTVIPTVLDTERFTPLTRDVSSLKGSATDATVIVWIGLAYNFRYLKRLVPVLRILQLERNVRFRVISSRPPTLPEVVVEFRPWSFENEVADLQSSHIGVMPLPNTEWARGKCGLKLLQYMAVGIPAVVSPVGVNRDIVSHGVNGFLAETEFEWVGFLSQLCHDADLRTRMGKAARRTVEERYSLQVWGPRLVEQYRTLAPERESLDAVSPVT